MRWASSSVWGDFVVLVTESAGCFHPGQDGLVDAEYLHECGEFGMPVVGREGAGVNKRDPESPAEADGTTGLFTALGKMVKLLRERKGLTQKEFGALVGYGPDTISAMEGRTDAAPRAAGEDRRNPGCRGPVEGGHPGGQGGDGEGSDPPSGVVSALRRAGGGGRIAVRLQHDGCAGAASDGGLRAAVFTQRHPPLDEETIEKRVADRLSRQQLFEK